jgi:Fic family protein
MDFTIPLSEWTLNAVSSVDRLKGQWAAGTGVSGARLRRVTEAARIQSVAASCRLSGIRVSDSDVAGLLRDQAVPTRDAEDVRAYARAFDQGLPSLERVLSTADLQALHGALVASPTIPPAPSPWRTRPHQFETFDANGRATGCIFSALPPRMLEDKVGDMLTWLELELRGGERHPVLAIGVFLLGFLAASPFESHNGRTARLLAVHLLRRSGYDYLPLASLELQMELLRDEFTDAFDRAQTRFWKGESDLEPWLGYYLEVLTRHRERVESKLELERGDAAQSPLQRKILEVVREHGDVDAGLLLGATGANRNTLKDNLRRLVDRGLLERTGQKRGTRYRLAAGDLARTATGSPVGSPT